MGYVTQCGCVLHCLGRKRRQQGLGEAVDGLDAQPAARRIEHPREQGPRPLEVDLTGQVAADTLLGKLYSGIGGQMDFIRGAALSQGGVPIIADIHFSVRLALMAIEAGQRNTLALTAEDPPPSGRMTIRTPRPSSSSSRVIVSGGQTMTTFQWVIR